MQFSKEIDEDIQPIDPQEEFDQPLSKLYATFSYVNMASGDQWSALWYRVDNSKLICYETKPWDGGTGGYGYSDCTLLSTEWFPGTYEVQFFIGYEWKTSGRFVIIGEPPTPTFTITTTATSTSTATITPINYTYANQYCNKDAYQNIYFYDNSYAYHYINTNSIKYNSSICYPQTN